MFVPRIRGLTRWRRRARTPWRRAISVFTVSRWSGYTQDAKGDFEPRIDANERGWETAEQPRKIEREFTEGTVR